MSGDDELHHFISSTGERSFNNCTVGFSDAVLGEGFAEALPDILASGEENHAGSIDIEAMNDQLQSIKPKTEAQRAEAAILEQLAMLGGNLVKIPLTGRQKAHLFAAARDAKVGTRH